MKGFLIRWFVQAVGLGVTAWLVGGIRVQGLGALLFASLLIGFLNAFVRPVLVLLTLPLTLVTLGIFVLVINALLFWFASAIVPGFLVSGFGAAFVGTILMSILGFVLNLVIGRHGRVEVLEIRA